MKKLCLLLIAVLLVFSTFAQSEKGVIYLKNGSILKGRYLYFDNSEKLKVESAGNVWVFPVNEIDSVINHRVARNQKIEEAFLARKLFVHAELGVLAGNAENSQSAPMSVSGSLNYSVLTEFSVGAGIGVEFLKESYLPVFFNLEYKFRNSVSTPYLFLKGGYHVPLEESRELYYDVWPAWSSSIWPGPTTDYETLDSRGGVLVNPGIGYQRYFSSGFGMTFAFGYQFHRLHYKGENDYGLDIDFNRLTIKIGILFN